MRGESQAFTIDELTEAPGCIHSVKQADCASCVRSYLWYQGRIDGLQEVAEMLGRNAAMVDAMYVACMEAAQRQPGWFSFEASASDNKQERPDA